MRSLLRRFRLSTAARAAAACALAGTSVAIARDDGTTLAATFAAHHLELVPGSVHWLDGPRLRPRRALVLAREHGQPSDLFAVTARTGAHEQIIAVDAIANLTRSPDADETDLVVQGARAAFVTRVQGRAVAFTRIDTRGEPDAGGDDRATRVRSAISRWQQTGQLRGYGMDRYDLNDEQRALRLGFTHGRLEAIAGAQRVVVERDGHIVEGADLVRVRPRTSTAADNWVTWAVDIVRAVPWIGSAPIAWAEGLAFSARHAAHRASAAVTSTATRAADTQREVAEDLADVLAIRSTGPLEGRVDGWPPPPLSPPIRPAIEHEGEWSPVAGANDPFVQTNAGAPPPMYLTFVRTDREIEDARAYIVVWDPRQIELHVAPGSQEPIGATGETGTGVVPRDEDTLLRLVGGFNGAFQGLHGEYGVYAEGELLLPPKPYAATVAAMADGSTAFGSWPPEQHEIPPDIVEFRQNLTPLIDHGVYNAWHRDDWGPVLNNPADLRTARTGLCLTHEGFVAFFWGNDLNPRGLADAMLAARCDYGIHLDMNGANTGFDFYRVAHAGMLPPTDHRVQSGNEAEGAVDEMPGLVFRARRLVRGMQHQASRYIHRNPRDFFYLLLRRVLPGPAITPVIEPAVPGEGSWHVAGLGDLPFPWPLARTRIRPDASQPERWVNLVRIDARRVALAPPDSTEHLVARVTGATAASGAGSLRIAMTTGPSGPAWAIGNEGTGIAVEPLASGASALRGACIDGNGFLVFAVADRAQPDLVSRALERAGCSGTRVAVAGASFVLPNGESVEGARGEASHEPTTFTLVARDETAGRGIFPEVTPVPRAVWYPVQTRRVRYFPNPGNNVTVQVRLSGSQSPTVFRLPGIGEQFVRQAYPDGGAPPEIRSTN